MTRNKRCSNSHKRQRRNRLIDTDATTTIFGSLLCVGQRRENLCWNFVMQTNTHSAVSKSCRTGSRFAWKLRLAMAFHSVRSSTSSVVGMLAIKFRHPFGRIFAYTKVKTQNVFLSFFVTFRRHCECMGREEKETADRILVYETI